MGEYYSDQQLEEAHDKAYLNRQKLGRSFDASCFYCLKESKISAIIQWIDEGETALCPYCNNDTLITGYNSPFLNAMNRYWFGEKLDKQKDQIDTLEQVLVSVAFLPGQVTVYDFPTPVLVDSILIDCDQQQVTISAIKK